MKRLTLRLVLIGTVLQSALSADIDAASLKQLQGEWTVEEWTGYKPLAMYEGYVAPSYSNDYSGSKLSVSGTNTIWQLRTTQSMKRLLLGLFSEDKHLTARKEGDITFYTDKASIVALQSGNPGKLRFANARSGGSGAYAAIWSLQNDRLIICKAKNEGAKCSESMEIPRDDFSNTRIVLRRAARVSADNAPQLDQPEMVRASHILLLTSDPKTGTDLPPEQKAAKRKQIEDLLKRARAGEDFANMAKEYSEDPASKENGGEYKFARGRMVPEFEAAAFSLKNAGDISDVVTTAFGYHIIKLNERIPKADAKRAQDSKSSEDWRAAENRFLTLLNIQSFDTTFNDNFFDGMGAITVGNKFAKIYDKNRQVLGVKWVPSDPALAKLTVQDIRKACGKPYLSFDTEEWWGRLGYVVEKDKTIYLQGVRHISHLKKADK
jgi:parvulin-like peptidyl-prolyl isomerase